MYRSAWRAAMLLWACITLLTSAPGVPAADAAPSSDCRVRIIVALAKPAPPPIDGAWVQDLAAASGVQLRYLRAITPNLYVFRMIAPGGAGGCGAAIERLRADPRLRSVQFDQQRKHEGG
jgi:hypothetical protein